MFLVQVVFDLRTPCPGTRPTRPWYPSHQLPFQYHRCSLTGKGTEIWMNTSHGNSVYQRHSPIWSPLCSSPPSTAPGIEVPGAESFDFRSSCPETASVKPRCRSHLLAPQLNWFDLLLDRDRIEKPRSPLGSTSSSARNPSGPTAMLVGVPRETCLWGGLIDFLDFCQTSDPFSCWR